MGNYERNFVIENGIVKSFRGFGYKEIIIPEGVTGIKYDAFRLFCGGVEKITLPKSLHDFKGSFFCFMSNLKEVHISSLDAWLKNYYKYESCNPLYDAHNLYLNGELVRDLVITDSVTHINKYALSGCRSIKNVHINDIESWYNGAYKFVYDLPAYELFLNGEPVSRLIISDSITEIPAYCFKNCISLTEIIIPSSVVSIGKYAFCGCSSLVSITIPSSVTNIGKYAFCGCSSLVSITIPSSVTNIGEKAFMQCTSLKEVHIFDIAAWCRIDFKKGDDGLLGYSSNPLCNAHDLYVNGKIVYDLVIPDGVSSIGEAAFFGCTSLVSIKIPDTVTNIGENAFGKCESLRRISIPDSITNIEEVFYGCPALHYYYVCEDDTIIKRYAFDIPSEIDEAYETARMNYTITYYHEDSADDDGDNGMGYDYDNSYVIHRAPKKNEIIIKNGKLYGFVVCGEKNPLLISSAGTVTVDRYNSPRYKSGYTWNLTYDPCIPRYMWVPGMKASSKDHIFAPKDFPENLVKAVVKQVGIQDNRGYFDGEFDVTVELTDAAVTDPAGTMDKFLSFNSRSTLLKHP